MFCILGPNVIRDWDRGRKVMNKEGQLTGWTVCNKKNGESTEKGHVAMHEDSAGL